MCVNVDEPWEAIWSHHDALGLPGQKTRCAECDRDLAGEHHVWESLGPLTTWDDEGCDHKSDDCPCDDMRVDEDEATEFRFCFQCLAARVWLERVCNSWLYGGVLEDLEHHFVDEMRPIQSLPLGRLVVASKRQWRRRDGSLVPPEAVEGWANQGAQMVAEHLKKKAT